MSAATPPSQPWPGRAVELATAAYRLRLDHDQLPLLEAWEQWDRLPGDERKARNMHYACQRAAAQAGTTSTKLRIRLVELRQAGATRAEAVAAAARELGFSP